MGREFLYRKITGGAGLGNDGKVAGSKGAWHKEEKTAGNLAAGQDRL